MKTGNILEDDTQSLKYYLVRESIKGGTDSILGAKFGCLEPPDDVLKGGCHHEVLLLQTQLLALKEVVIGIQHTRNVLSKVTVKHSLDVFSIVDCKEKSKGCVHLRILSGMEYQKILNK